MQAVIVDGKIRIVGDRPPRDVSVKLLAKSIVQNLVGMHLTKGEIVREFGVTRAVATAVIHALDAVGALLPAPRDARSGWAEKKYVVCPPTQARRAVQQADAARAKHEAKMRRLFELHGIGKCDRCGGTMPGRSQKNKHKRGHGRTACDLAMASLIHES